MSQSTAKAGRPEIRTSHPSLDRRRGVNHLLVIAIDRYEHCPRLYNCVKDARAFIELVTEKYQFEPENVYTLFDEQATEKAILDQLRRMVEIVQPEDNLVLYYSGHGEYEHDIKEGYWVPADAPVGHSGEYISNSRIAKFVRAFGAHHVLLIVDSCFSGSLFATRQLEASTERLDSIPSRWVITSGRNQVVSDGRRGEHSPFAENLIYFLRHNPDSSLAITELINRVVNAVVYDAEQTPRGEPLQNVGHKGGQFFFYRKGVLPPPRSAARQRSLSSSTRAASSATPRSSGRTGWLIGMTAFVLLGAAVLLWVLSRQAPTAYLAPNEPQREETVEAAGEHENGAAAPEASTPPETTMEERPAPVDPPAQVESLPPARPLQLTTNMRNGGRLVLYLRGGRAPYLLRVLRRGETEAVYTGEWSAAGEHRIDLSGYGLRGGQFLIITIKDAAGQVERQPTVYME